MNTPLFPRTAGSLAWIGHPIGYHHVPSAKDVTMAKGPAKITRTSPQSALFTPAQGVALAMRAPSVDAVGLEERAASLAKRSIKRESKLWALDLAIRCMDLTSLDGSDTPGRIVAMCAKALRPDPRDHTVPPVAAVCVYPQLVPVAVDHIRGTNVRVASVAGGFPSGRAPLHERLRESRHV